MEHLRRKVQLLGDRGVIRQFQTWDRGSHGGYPLLVAGFAPDDSSVDQPAVWYGWPARTASCIASYILLRVSFGVKRNIGILTACLIDATDVHESLVNAAVQVMRDRKADV